MKYRSEVDGLRALAVVPVIFFHAGFEVFSGGFVGVDVFFVISGYLITTIIINEMDESRFSLINFYERRARRILPALCTMIFVCLPFAWFILMPQDLQDFAQSLLAVVTFSSNILFWQESGYFDTAAELKPLLHTWSLAVEEQFYIFFPPLLMLMWSLGRRAILGLLAVVFVLSLLLAQWGAYNSPTAAFYLLPTRGWELLIGSFAAFYLQRRQVPLAVPVQNILSFAGLVMIVLSIFIYNKATPFPSLYALLPTLGTVFIILFATKGTLANSLLSHKALVGIGLISYSAYLWHQPLIVFSKYTTFELSLLHKSALILVTFVLSFLTWKYIETPARKGRGISTNQVFIGSGAVFAVLIALGLHGHFQAGYPGRKVSLSGVSLLSYNDNNRALQEQSWALLREKSQSQGYAVEHNKFDKTAWFQDGDPRRNLLLVGNSHSKDVWNVLQNSQSAQSAFEVARYGTQISNLPKDPAFFSSPNFTDSDVVMLVSRYNGRDYAALEAVSQKILEQGKQLVIVRSTFEFPLLQGGLMTLADQVVAEEYSEGGRDGEEISQASNAAYYQYFTEGRAAYDASEGSAVIRDIAAKHSEIIVLDRTEYICAPEDKACYSLDAELQKYFYDYGHHTLTGAAFFGQRVDQVKWLDGLIAPAVLN